MRNLSDTQAYSFADHVLSRAVYAMSRVVGVRNITRPFWNRWRAALIDQDTLARMLAAIGDLENWPDAGSRFLEQEVRAFESRRESLPAAQQISEYRRLSFLGHLVQWGCLPLCDTKRAAYRLARDYYLEAEQMAFGDRFARIGVPWAGATLWGNLHLPESGEADARVPLVLLVHGMDDVKEEHLATELALVAAGFAVFCIDGPGQGEAFLLDGLVWPPGFEDAMIAAVDRLGTTHPNVDTSRYAMVGVSWGGMWIYKVAAKDPRALSLLDLGGPVDARDFDRLPFFLKSKFCQILGAASPAEVPEAAMTFSIRDVRILRNVRAHVHIVHGKRDPLVRTADKQWLEQQLARLGGTRSLALTVYPDGDHCCTQHAVEIRKLAIELFADAYRRAIGSGDVPANPPSTDAGASRHTP